MSHGKTPEELLAAARSAPAELSYDEVVQRFLNPVPLPPDQSWWQRWGGYLKPFLMLSLVLVLTLFLWPSDEAVMAPILSSFPVSEVVYGDDAVEPLPGRTGVSALTVPGVRINPPRLQAVASPTSAAPATAPKNVVAVPAPDAPVTTVTPVDQPVKQPSGASGEMPPALFSGRYSLKKDNLMLGYALEEGTATNLLFLDITEAERRSVKKAGHALTFEREAGSLLLYPDGDDGRFEFLPNNTYRAELTARGWGPENSNPKGFIEITGGKSDDDRKASDRRVTDQLWFRYFTTDINKDYVSLLRSYGYTDEDLTDLWQLANWSVKYDEVKKTLETAAVVLTDRAPLAKIHSLHFRLETLQQMKRAGQRMSFEDFMVRKNLSSKSDNGLESFKVGDIPSLASKEIRDDIKQQKDFNFSLDRPGTKSDTIAYTFGEKLMLKGNFEFRISKDLNRDYIVVYGPEKQVVKMSKRSDYEALELTHKNKRNPLYIELPIGVYMFMDNLKGATTEIKMKRPKQ